MKTLGKILITLLLTVTAQVATASKIAVLDLSILFKDSKFALEAKEELDAKFSKKRTEVESRTAEYERKEARLKRESDTLTAEQKSKWQKEIHELRNDLQKMLQEYQAEFNRDQYAKQKKFEKMIVDVLDGIAKKKKLDVVLNKNNILFSKDALDITDDVLKALDKNDEVKK